MTGTTTGLAGVSTWLGSSRGRLGAVLMCLLITGACEPQDQTMQAVTDPLRMPPLTIESEVTIGGDAATGPSALGAIGTARLIEASVFVPELIAQEIRVFNLSGEHVETFGRRGEGPGEYEDLGAVFDLPGGGVVGWERAPRTATIHGASGIETVPLLRGQFPGRTPRLLGVLRDTSFVMGLPQEARDLRDRPPGRFTDTVPFVWVDRRGIVRDTIALVEAPPREFFNLGPMWGLELDIFGDEVRAIAADEWLVTVSGREVRRYSMSGVSRVHDWEPPPPVITPDLAGAERERRIGELGTARVRVAGGGDLAEMHREVIQGLPVAEALPAFDDLAAGDRGAVWVRTLTMPTDTTSGWFLIDADGNIQGRLQLPAGERIESGSAEHVVVKSRDSLGSLVLRILKLRGLP